MYTKNRMAYSTIHEHPVVIAAVSFVLAIVERARVMVKDPEAPSNRLFAAIAARIACGGRSARPSPCTSAWRWHRAARQETPHHAHLPSGLAVENLRTLGFRPVGFAPVHYAEPCGSALPGSHGLVPVILRRVRRHTASVAGILWLSGLWFAITRYRLMSFGPTTMSAALFDATERPDRRRRPFADEPADNDTLPDRAVRG